MRRNGGGVKPVYVAWMELKALQYTGGVRLSKGIGIGFVVVIGLVATASLSLTYLAQRFRRKRSTTC